MAAGVLGAAEMGTASAARRVVKMENCIVVEVVI